MKGYQLWFRGNYLISGKESLLIQDKVYLNLDDVTEEKIEEFKNYCANGHGDFEIDRSTINVAVVVVQVIK